MIIEKLHSDSALHQNSGISAFKAWVPVEQRDADIKKIVKKLKSDLVIPGFRKGHAPDAMIIRDYPDDILEALYKKYRLEMLEDMQELTSDDVLLHIVPLERESDLASPSGWSMSFIWVHVARIPESVIAGLPSRISMPACRYEHFVTALERFIVASLRLVLVQEPRPVAREDFVLVRCVVPSGIRSCLLSKSMVDAADFLKEANAFQAAIVARRQQQFSPSKQEEAFIEILIDVSHSCYSPEEVINALIGMRKGEKKTFSYKALSDSIKGPWLMEGWVEVQEIFSLSSSFIEVEDIAMLGYSGREDELRALIEFQAAETYEHQMRNSMFDAIVQDLFVCAPVFVPIEVVTNLYGQIIESVQNVARKGGLEHDFDLEGFLRDALFRLSYMLLATMVLGSVTHLSGHQKILREDLMATYAWRSFSPHSFFLSDVQDYDALFRYLYSSESFIWNTYFGELNKNLSTLVNTKYNNYLQSGGSAENTSAEFVQPLVRAKSLLSESVTVA